MPMYGEVCRFRDMYVDLIITDNVNKITTHEEWEQLELENCVKRSGPYLERYDSKYSNASTKLIQRLQTKRVVLIGNPNTGKSIFCRRIIHMYIDNELPNRWALLVNCRNPQLQQLEDPNNRLTLRERLKRFLETAIDGFDSWKVILENILSTNGLKLLLIIDGLDEFPMEHFEHSLLYKILRKDILPQCSLLLTSRVGAFNEMMKKYQFEVKLEKIFQVEGFSKSQRDEYIKKRLGRRDPVYEERLRNMLRNQTELDALSHNPYIIQLLASLIEESGTSRHRNTGLNTLTDAFGEIVLFLIKGEIQRNQKCKITPPNKLEDMPRLIFEYLIRICELAYLGLKRKTRDTLNQLNSEIYNQEAGECPLGLGLVMDTTSEIHFNHITIQEYLAAYYLSYKHLLKEGTNNLEAKRAELLLSSTGEKLKVNRLVAKFLCGLLGKESVFLISHILKEDNIKWLPYDGCIRTLTVDRRERYAKYTKFHLLALPYIVETKQINMLAFKEAQMANGGGT